MKITFLSQEKHNMSLKYRSDEEVMVGDIIAHYLSPNYLSIMEAAYKVVFIYGHDNKIQILRLRNNVEFMGWCNNYNLISRET